MNSKLSPVDWPLDWEQKGNSFFFRYFFCVFERKIGCWHDKLLTIWPKLAAHLTISELLTNLRMFDFVGRSKFASVSCYEVCKYDGFHAGLSCSRLAHEQYFLPDVGRTAPSQLCRRQHFQLPNGTILFKDFWKSDHLPKFATYSLHRFKFWARQKHRKSLILNDGSSGEVVTSPPLNRKVGCSRPTMIRARCLRVRQHYPAQKNNQKKNCM